MKFKIIILLLSLMCSVLYGHRQHTHQYLTIQGYKLLERTLLKKYPVLFNNLGTFEQNIGDYPWIEGKIITGAWREDCEDIVYGFSMYNPPPGCNSEFLQWLTVNLNNQNEFYSSVTHFWQPESGDTEVSGLRTYLYSFPVYGIQTLYAPNAYQKMTKLAYGGYSFPVSLITHDLPYYGNATSHSIVYLQYNSITDLYKNRNLYVTKVVNSATGQVYELNPRVKLTSNHLVLRNIDNLIDCITFEILGRMCHLLQDMSVPAHVHRDCHGSSDDGIRQDCYENYFGYDFGFDFMSVYNNYGAFINPVDKINPLHFLMYTTAQMADHFGSNGPYEGDGNDVIGANALQDEITFLNQMNIPSFGGPMALTNPLTDNDKLNIRSKMIPQAIRATAGLLYWFATQAGLIEAPILSAGISGTEILYNGNTGYWSAGYDGGYGPHSYTWEKKYDALTSVRASRVAPGGDWYTLGLTSANINIPYNAADTRSFSLRCTVTDSIGNSAVTNILHVEVNTSIQPLSSTAYNPSNKNSVKLNNEQSKTDISSYPNPFNPSTTIKYSLQEESLVSIKIYNVISQEVAVLVNETKSAGVHFTSFNSGALPSGIYIARLHAGNIVKSIKLQLLK